MRLFISAFFFFSVSALFSQNEQLQEHFQKTATVKISIDYPYLLHIPKSKSTAIDGQLPLLIFLHGSGERGHDFELLKKHGPPKIIESGADFPFITLTPQCPLNQRWDALALNELIDEIIKKHPVDTSRIYLTGLSMGGYGTWDLAIKFPTKFAAIAPICGGSDTNAWDAPNHILTLPIWAFHGAMDQVVPLERTVNIIKNLKAAGANPKLTIYPMAGHDSWTETYDNPELYTWLLTHRTKN